MWTLDLPRLAQNCIPCSGQTCAKLYTLFRVKSTKTIICPVAHPRIGHIREYLPPGQDSRLEEEEKKPQHKRISHVSFARGAVLFCSA